MSNCFICQRSGRGLGIRRGTFWEHFCSIACQDAAFAVLQRAGVPKADNHLKAAFEYTMRDIRILLELKPDIATYSAQEAQTLVNNILTIWQTGCYVSFCAEYQLPVPSDYTPKPNNSTDTEYAEDAVKAAGGYLGTVFGTDTSRWTDAMLEGFVFAIVDSVRKQSVDELPF